MNRNDMLTILHSLKLGVELTALTTEAALECIYVTSKGVSHEWRELHDWPVYKLKNIDLDKFIYIKNQVKQKKLKIEDLEGTELKNLYFSEGEKISDSESIFFENIINISLCDDGKLYVFIDEDVAYFFEEYSAFEKEFGERFVP
jgi:hypothetical protein